MQKTKKKCLVFASSLLVCISSMLCILSGCGGSYSGELTKFGESSHYDSSVQGEASDSSLEEESEAFSSSDAAKEEIEEKQTSDAAEEDISGSNGVIFVHLCGAVKEPGVYEVESGSRLYEVLKRAGGLKEEACDTYLNQAQVLTDGSQIYVPTKEEVASGAVENDLSSQGEGAKSSEASENGEKEDETSASDKVNINSADINELMTLPGIGEAKAKAIMEYRESNGGFRSIEELMNISGIKEGVFNKIKDSITV